MNHFPQLLLPLHPRHRLLLLPILSPESVEMIHPSMAAIQPTVNGCHQSIHFGTNQSNRAINWQPVSSAICRLELTGGCVLPSIGGGGGGGGEGISTRLGAVI